MGIKSQFIIGVRNEYLQSLGLVQGLNRLCLLDQEHEATSHLIIGQRERLEHDASVRQLLPYVVMNQMCEDGESRFIVYRRGKGVGESRLAGNVSIGFGGHIDLADVVTAVDSVVDLRATMVKACDRELEEEVLCDGVPLRDQTVHSVGLITDNSDKVGLVHLGMVMICSIPMGVEVTCREEELEILKPMTANELLSSGLPLENWTKIILRAIVGELE